MQSKTSTRAKKLKIPKAERDAGFEAILKYPGYYSTETAKFIVNAILRAAAKVRERDGRKTTKDDIR